MMENKRSPCAVDQGSLPTLTSKRHKADLSISAKVSSPSCPVFFFFFHFSIWSMFFTFDGKSKVNVHQKLPVKFSADYLATCDAWLSLWFWNIFILFWLVLGSHAFSTLGPLISYCAFFWYFWSLYLILVDECMQ